MTRRSWMLGIAVLCGIVAVLLGYRQFSLSRGIPEENRKPHEALGSILAEETSHLLNGKGQVVVLCCGLQNGAPGPRDAGAEAFCKVAGRYGLKVTATEYVAVRYSPEGRPAIAPERFQELIEQHAGTGAIVSFISSPALTDEEVARLPAKRPRLVCVNTDATVTNVFDLVVVPRAWSGSSESKPTSLRGWFDRHFRIIRSPLSQ